MYICKPIKTNAGKNFKFSAIKNHSVFVLIIKNDKTILERDPLERAANQGELFAYKHKGFWQCMDTKRDHEKLESIYKEGAPWQKKK